MGRKLRILAAALVAVSLAILVAEGVWRHGGGVEVSAVLRGHRLSVEISVKNSGHRVSEICFDSSCYPENTLVTGSTNISLFLDEVIRPGSRHNVSVFFADHAPISMMVKALPPPTTRLSVLNAFYMPGIGLRLEVVNNSTRTISITAVRINGRLAYPARLLLVHPASKPVSIVIPYKGPINIGNNTCILFLDNGAWIKLSFKA